MKARTRWKKQIILNRKKKNPEKCRKGKKKKKPGAGSSEGFAAPREGKRDGFEIPMGAEATTK